VRHRIGSTILAAAMLFAAGCATTAVESVNTALAEHFLEPFETAGIPYTVESTCHLQRRTASENWHLEVRVQIDADRREVADILEAQGMVLARDRDPMHVQQEPGEPGLGWNGALESSNGGTQLGLTYNNVEPVGPAEVGGWAEACPTGDKV
jgi:hypothetical protein